MNRWHQRLAVRVLRQGGLVLHATEGVWGLACDPECERAVARLLALKGRSRRKGLILIGSEPAMFAAELDALPDHVAAEIRAGWPGPVTWALPTARFPAHVTGGRATVAVRVPGHAGARALVRGFGRPLVSTSANRSGRPPARNVFQARRRFREFGCGGRLARRPFVTGVYFLPGETAGAAGPSAIRTPDGRELRKAR